MELFNRAPKVMVGLCGLFIAQQGLAAGLVEDSKLNILARNFFSNADNRSGAADPNYTQEWARGLSPRLNRVLPRAPWALA